MTRVYFNTNQESWCDQYPDCSEWWPAGTRNVKLGSVFSLEIDGDFDKWATIRCGGKEVCVEMSGKRIGMYGPTMEMSDSEMVDWFDRSMKELGDFDRNKAKRPAFSQSVVIT